ncbi:Uncharacterised protein [Chlamydia trachomatis]|nr:Uncharacterised protein [Chlamydia trachomatis]
MTIRVSRRIEENKNGIRPRIRLPRINWNGSCSAKTRANVIGRISNLWDKHHISRANSQQTRNPGNRFLRTDGGNNTGQANVHHIATLPPCEDRFAHFLSANDRRITVGIRRCRKCVADKIRSRIDGGSHRKIADPIGMRRSKRLRGSKLIPRKFRKI